MEFRTAFEHNMQARSIADERGLEHYALWFRAAPNYEQQISYARENFTNIYLNEQFRLYLGGTEDKTCLEIGFGGGRLLMAASPHFKKVIGLDIHNAFDYTAQLLDAQGVDNYELLHVNDRDKIADGSIDFAMSYLVFSHLMSWDEAIDYFKYLSRVMKKDGSAGIIYFGYTPLKGVIEQPTRQLPGWWQSLRVNPQHACEAMSEYFDVIKCEIENPRWSGSRNPYRQFYIRFVNKGSCMPARWPIPAGELSVLEDTAPVSIAQRVRARAAIQK